VDDLQEVFEGWLRSRVGDGSVTEGGYDTDVEGMRAWRSDCSEFLVWLQANEPEMFGEFRYRYSSLDSEGWKALVGFGGDYHDESQLESDLEALVDNPVGEDVPAPTVTTPAPATTTTTTTVPPRSQPQPPPTTTTQPPVTTTTPPPTTTKPPRTIPVTPDTGPEVTAPPTTTVPADPETGGRGRRVKPVEGRVPEVPEHPEHSGSHANIGQGFERLIGSPSAELHHGYSVNQGVNLRPSREGFSQAGWDPVIEGAGAVIGGVKAGLGAVGDFFSDSGPVGGGPGPADRGSIGRGGRWPGGSAGRAIVENLELSENGRFLALVMNDLFDWMNSAQLRSPYQDEIDARITNRPTS